MPYPPEGDEHVHPPAGLRLRNRPRAEEQLPRAQEAEEEPEHVGAEVQRCPRKHLR